MDLPECVTASRLESSTQSHRFTIYNYSRIMREGITDMFPSRIFAVGGYEWAIRFNPIAENEKPANSEYFSVYLEFKSKSGEAQAAFDFFCLDRNGRAMTNSKISMTFVFTPDTYISSPIFMRKSTVEESRCLINDHIPIQCDLTVLKEPRIMKLRGVQVPHSDMIRDLRPLLTSGEKADAIFIVGGREFKAHRAVLAVRTPVLKEELCGPVKEKNLLRIEITNIQGAVFGALLEYIYSNTNTLQPESQENGSHSMALVEDLLVMADRYGLELDRLKICCEANLAKRLEVGNVGRILALADRYHCLHLKEVCFDFIFSSTKVLFRFVLTEGFSQLKSSYPELTKEMDNIDYHCMSLNSIWKALFTVKCRDKWCLRMDQFYCLATFF